MSEVPKAIRRFVAALESADWESVASCYADDALFDASVPNWHFQLEGLSQDQGANAETSTSPGNADQNSEL